MTLACSEDTLFMTFNQARNLGGNVRKGEKGWPVVLWKWFTKEEGAEDTERAEAERVPWVTYYTVFGLSQIENRRREDQGHKAPRAAEPAGLEINHFIELTGGRIVSPRLAQASTKPAKIISKSHACGQFRIP
jgi:antirestriction protein ArdC